jgi:hypothetical protein
MIPKPAAPFTYSVFSDASSDIALSNVHGHQAVKEDINSFSAISGSWNLFHILGSAFTHFRELLHQYHNVSIPGWELTI